MAEVALLLLTGGLLLATGLPVAAAVLALKSHLTPKTRRRLRLALVSSIAFYIGLAICWRLLTPGWHLPVWTTIQASVDSETFGHPVEHQAENLLCWTLLGAEMLSFAATGLTSFVLRGRRVQTA